MGITERQNPPQGMPRTYRRRTRSSGLVFFQVAIKETDLWIGAERNLEQEARDHVLALRRQLESYIQVHPDFRDTLEPYREDVLAPPLVREMIRAARAVGVGPMAAVAGALAQFVGRALQGSSEQVIVENGGDIYLHARRPLTVAVYAGKSPLSGRLGLRVACEQMPLGVCASSGTLGHSLSLGRADAVCLLSPSAALADAAATALGNRIRSAADLEKACRAARRWPEIIGGLVILGERLATWGAVELVKL